MRAVLLGDIDLNLELTDIRNEADRFADAHICADLDLLRCVPTVAPIFAVDQHAIGLRTDHQFFHIFPHIPQFTAVIVNQRFSVSDFDALLADFGIVVHDHALHGQLALCHRLFQLRDLLRIFVTFEDAQCIKGFVHRLLRRGQSFFSVGYFFLSGRDCLGLLRNCIRQRFFGIVQR